MGRFLKRAVEAKKYRESPTGATCSTGSTGQATGQRNSKSKVQHNVLIDSTNFPMEKKSPPSQIHSQNTRNQASKSPCLYSRVKRESAQTKNMIVEEKLALYEFEVDENEPTRGKGKGKQNHKGKRKYSSDEDFLPTKHRLGKNSSKMSLEAQGAVSMQTRAREVQRKKTPLSEVVSVSPQQKRKLSETICGDMSTSGASHTKRALREVNTPGTRENLVVCLRRLEDDMLSSKSPGDKSLSLPKETSVGEAVKSRCAVDSESINIDLNTPVARPKRKRTTARRSLEGELFGISECGEKANAQRVLRESTESPELEASALADDCTSESEVKEIEAFEINNEIGARKSEACRQEPQSKDISANAPPKPAAQQESTPSQVKPRALDCLSEGFSVNPPSEAQPSGHDTSSVLLSVSKRTYLNSSRSLSSLAPVKHSSAVAGFSKVYFVPRLSVGMGSVNEPAVKDWGIDNCFGFEEDTEELGMSPVPRTSVPQTAKTVFLTSSTPQYQTCSSNVLPTRVVPEVKSIASHSYKPISQTVTTKPAVLAEAQQPRSNVLSEKPMSAFSSPCLKQAKLNFNPESPQRTPLSKQEAGENAATPVLFEDNDKTPIHFTEPSRRSYKRLVRRKHVANYGELDKEEEDEINEKENKSKKPKRHGRNHKEEIKAKKWMKEFNSECGEIEEFELCVE